MFSSAKPPQLGASWPMPTKRAWTTPGTEGTGWDCEAVPEPWERTVNSTFPRESSRSTLQLRKPKPDRKSGWALRSFPTNSTPVTVDALGNVRV